MTEYTTAVNSRILLTQKAGMHTYGSDAFLLSAFVRLPKITPYSKAGKVCEIGTGAGIISLLLIARNGDYFSSCARCIDAVEVQPDIAELARKNAELNGMDDRLSVFTEDIRNFGKSGEYSCVFTNPPYMKSGAGINSATDEKNAARREIFGTIFELCSSAGRLLKTGGSFFCVYRPDRLTDLICAMRGGGIEPKTIVPVFPANKQTPSLLLVKGIKGGGAELIIREPLVLEGAEYDKIYSGGAIEY